MNIKTAIASLSVIAICIEAIFIICPPTLQDAAVSYHEYLVTHPFHPDSTRRLDLGSMPKKDRPDLAWQQDFLRTMDPSLKRPAEERLSIAREQVDGYFELRRQSRVGTSEFPWIERGPNNVGGRTRAMMWDPNDANGSQVWCGGVTGGLWYNEDVYDSQEPWVNVSDFWANIAVTCMTSDPNDPNVFYVGTGEGLGVRNSRGAGIWKSSDGGANWSQLANTTDFYYVNDLIVRDESGTSIVYAAVSEGYYQGQWHGSEGVIRSMDGGVSWSQVGPSISGSSATYAVADLELSASNRIWAGTNYSNTTGTGGGTLLYSDNGTDWVIAYSTSVGNWSGRVELACAPSDYTVVYAAIESSRQVSEMIMTTDDGASWSAISEPSDDDTNISNTDFSRGQAWYDLTLAVNPTNPDELYVGGIDLFKSSDAGVSWSQFSHWYGGFGHQYVHADQHQIIFKPNSSTDAVFGNDGGMSLSTSMDDDIPTVQSRNKNYNVTQFYAGAIHPDANTDYFLAGAQDNGTQQFTKSGLGDTEESSGGDGAYAFIDQNNPNIQIVSYVYNSYRLSTDGGVSFSAFSDDVSSGSFINPSDYDDNMGILYANAGSSSLARWTGIKAGSPVRDDLSVSLGSSATHVRVSPYTMGSTTLYVGTRGGKVHKITNAESTHAISTIFNNSTLGSISCVELGSSEDEILVTFFNYGVTSVWYTSDGGSTWESKEGDLPDMPVRWAIWNPNDRDQVILATELGIWITYDLSSSSPTWVSSNEGLANVRVDMLQIRDEDDEVIAFTHGRGAFTSSGFFEGDEQANFTTSASEVVSGSSITFQDATVGNVVGWEWTFENGTPSSSTDQSPVVVYSADNGRYDVGLTVTFSDGTTSSKYAPDQVSVVSSGSLPNIAPYVMPGWEDKITVYDTAGEYTSDAFLSSTGNIYFALALYNSGSASLSSDIIMKVVLDEVNVLYEVPLGFSSSSLDVGESSFYRDISLTGLSAGEHSLTVTFDEANSLEEEDETDNSYTRYFYVNDADNEKIVWDGAEWSNEIGPTSTDDVVFAGDYYFHHLSATADELATFHVNNVQVVHGASLNVGDYTYFQVDGNIEVNGDLIVDANSALGCFGAEIVNNGSITLKSAGSFYRDKASVWTGNDALIYRNTRYASAKYSFVGSPIQQTSVATGTLLGKSAYKYDETISYGEDEGLSRWVSASNLELVPGQGYTQASKKQLVFTGVPNAGDVIYAGSFTAGDGGHEGYHLVSNPYTTALSVGQFLTTNTNIASAIYLWDDNGSDTGRGSSLDYIVANALAATNPSRAGGETRYNGSLGSCQGFFVKLNGSVSTDVSFDASMQVIGENHDDNFFRKATDPLIRVNLENEAGVFRQAVIGERDDANASDLDRRYDAPAFDPGSTYGVFTLKSGHRLSIQAVLPGWSAIPLQINTGDEGNYELSAGLKEVPFVYLYDQEKGVVHDLTAGSYTFWSVPGQHERFILLSSPEVPLATLIGSQDKVYAINNVLHIKTEHPGVRAYTIHNLNGQVVRRLIVRGSSLREDLSILKPGVYMVSNQQFSTKVVVR